MFHKNKLVSIIGLTVTVFYSLFYHIHFNSFWVAHEPLKNEINKILGAEREDRFSDHFSDLYKMSVRFVFRTCSSSQAFSKSPAGHSKVPAEVPEIAGC